MPDDKKKAPFDSGSRPRSFRNKVAARQRGLRWNSRKGYYVDEDGALMRDRFGRWDRNHGKEEDGDNERLVALGRASEVRSGQPKSRL